MNSFLFSPIAAFRLAIIATATCASIASAEISLGWYSFAPPEFSSSGDLGTSFDIYGGAMTVTSSYGIGIGGTGLYDPLATGLGGTLAYEHSDDPLLGGVGVFSSPALSPTLDGSLATGAEQLTFRFNNGAAQLDTMSMVISGLEFGSTPFNISGVNLSADDPMLWLDTNYGVFQFNEQELMGATSFLDDGTIAGAQSGFIDFAAFTSKLDYNTMINGFTLRETNGSIQVKDLYVGTFSGTLPVPEPGSGMLVLLLSVGVIIRRRRFLCYNGLL